MLPFNRRMVLHYVKLKIGPTWFGELFEWSDLGSRLSAHNMSTVEYFTGSAMVKPEYPEGYKSQH